jgi:hypothetical protein
MNTKSHNLESIPIKNQKQSTVNTTSHPPDERRAPLSFGLNKVPLVPLPPARKLSDWCSANRAWHKQR